VPDNVELVRRCLAAIGAWDVEALLSLFHPDVELLPLTGTRVESGGYRGHAGVRRYMEEAQDLWDVLQPMGEAFEDLGHYVLVATAGSVGARAGPRAIRPAPGSSGCATA
jgi:ketosteroid isomerase-like protein